MMIRKTTLALVIGLNLAASGAFAATQAKAGGSAAKNKSTQESVAAKLDEKRPATHVTSGTVSTVADNKLVISHKVRGKSEEAAFALNADTKREGDLAVGSSVTVRYQMQGGENVATMVKARAVKAKKSGQKT